MDMFNMIKQAQQLQKNLKNVQAELANRQVTGTAGAGMVTATFNGQVDLISLTIAPEIVRPENAQMLHDLVQSAVNDGLRKAKDLAKGEVGKLTGGLSIPGLF